MATKISNDGYKEIFNISPAAILVIGIDAPLYTILDVNEAYLILINKTREALLGKGILSAFPVDPTEEESKNIESIIFSFERVISSKKQHTLINCRHASPRRGREEFREQYWTTTNIPVLNENGNVKYLIHSTAKKAELNKLGEKEKTRFEALKNQRQQLYSTFMQAPVGIAIFRGPEYIVELINPPLCELYAKTAEEMLGKPVFEVLTHAKGIGFEELLDNVLLTGKPFRGQGLASPLMRSGKLETVYLNLVYEPFREDDGRISGVIAIATDITEHINAKLQIEEAEERARLAVDAVGLGTFDLNLLTGEMITSQVFANIFGFDAPVPRREYVKVIHPDDQELRSKAHKAAPETGRLFYEARVVWPDKTVRWVRVEGRVYYGTTSIPVRVLGTLLDITEQKKIKEALAESEQLLRNITTAAPTGLWMADAAGGITYVNKTWIDWTGLPFERHLGAGWLKAVVQEDKEKVLEKFANDLAKRIFHEVEFRINHSDGTIHWCVVNGGPQYRNEGTFVGYIGACVDITEQKHLERQKDDFIGIASHELKTPVTSIKAYAQVLEKMLLKKGEIKEAGMISKMDMQLNRLTSLIGDLLDVTKINTGKLQFNNSEFNLNILVKELVEDMQHTTSQHTLIESLAPPVVVWGDRERIGQVITNLISNAIKYSPNADEIIIQSELKENEVTLSIKDFGIGIAEQNMDKVFEQFYRVSGNLQHTFPGLGLGLYISSEIIKRQGGRIWVTSREKEGSTFGFALPLRNKKKT